MVRLKEAMGRPGKGIVAVIANAVACSDYWKSVMTDYVEHMAGLEMLGSKLASFKNKVQAATLTVTGLAALGEVLAELHLLKEGLRKGATSSLEEQSLQMVRSFSDMCKDDSDQETDIIQGLQRVLSDAIILWPEDVHLAEALQGLGQAMQKRSFADKVARLEQLANECWDVHLASPIDTEAVVSAWQVVLTAVEEPHLEAALAVADVGWKDTVWELIVEGFAFWAEYVFAADDYGVASDHYSGMTATLGKMVEVAGCKAHKSALQMFDAATAARQALSAVERLGKQNLDIIKADKDCATITSLKRAMVHWGSCEKVANFNGKHAVELVKCHIRLTNCVKEAEDKLLSLLADLEKLALKKVMTAIERLKPLAGGTENGTSWRQGFEGDWEAIMALAKATLFEHLDPEKLIAASTCLQEADTGIHTSH